MLAGGCLCQQLLLHRQHSQQEVSFRPCPAVPWLTSVRITPWLCHSCCNSNCRCNQCSVQLGLGGIDSLHRVTAPSNWWSELSRGMPCYRAETSICWQSACNMWLLSMTMLSFHHKRGLPKFQQQSQVALLWCYAWMHTAALSNLHALNAAMHLIRRCRIYTA